MRNSRTWRLLALLAVLAVVAAGCRSDDEGSADESETEATEEETSAAETESASEEASAAAGDVEFDVGVTEEPCPDAVNEDNGCIFLGILSDLTQGPFSPQAPSIVAAQEAFWQRVNEQGGVGGFDVNVSEYIRDNLYNPETQAQVWAEIQDSVLGLAQSLGSPTTAAIYDDLESNSVPTAPAAWNSAFEFQDVILESGNNYCVESMNAVDYALDEMGLEVSTVASVHYPTDYGNDGAAGVQVAAEARGLEFLDVPQTPIAAQGTTQGTVSTLVQQQPELVILTTGPQETAEIVGGAAAQGFTGRFIGTSPTWNVGLVQTPAIEALQGLYMQSGRWGPWEADTPAHEAMREAIGDAIEPNDGATAGWMWSYPMLAALEAAAENGDLTREGVMEAVGNLETVDYEGALPEEAGTFSGSPDEQAFRGTIFSEVNPDTATGVQLLTEEHFFGPTAEGFTFEEPCDQLLG